MQPDLPISNGGAFVGLVFTLCVFEWYSQDTVLISQCLAQLNPKKYIRIRLGALIVKYKLHLE